MSTTVQNLWTCPYGVLRSSLIFEKWSWKPRDIGTVVSTANIAGRDYRTHVNQCDKLKNKDKFHSKSLPLIDYRDFLEPVSLTIHMPIKKSAIYPISELLCHFEPLFRYFWSMMLLVCVFYLQIIVLADFEVSWLPG